MKLSQVALQCYTIRDHVKSAEDFAKSMKRVAEIGYPAVQISAVGPIPEAEILRIVSEEGMTICATHEGGQRIVEQPQAVVERLGKLGCRYTAYPYPHVALDTVDAVKQLAQDLNRAGEVLKKANMVLTYHNHAIELEKLDGRTILDILYTETDPELVQAEIDTYWVQAGGADPVAWCTKLERRLPLLHMKDYGVKKGDPVMAPVGAGNLDFPRITQAAEHSGCEWFIVEQDRDYDDPFKAIEQSFRYIETELCAAGA